MDNLILYESLDITGLSSVIINIGAVVEQFGRMGNGFKMPHFKKFKNHHIVAAGFYVLRWEYPYYPEKHKEKFVYLNDPRDHGNGHIESYFMTVPNYRDKCNLGTNLGCGMDMGQYIWPYGYRSYSSSYPPTDWREMTMDERKNFRKELYLFEKPSRLHPYGRVDENDNKMPSSFDLEHGSGS